VGTVRRAVGRGDLAWSRTRAHQRTLGRALRIVAHAGQQYGRLAVALSCGKDSTALLAVVDQIDPGAPVLFRRFPHLQDEPPDQARVLAELRKRFASHPFLIVPRASDFDAIRCREPGETIKQARRRIGGPSRVAARDAVLSSGCSGQYLGLRSFESDTRRYHLGMRGPIYYSTPWRMWIACPLAGWSEADVWALIASRDLPYDDLYNQLGRDARNETSFLRVGDIDALAAVYPRWARTLEVELGNGEPLGAICARAHAEWFGDAEGAGHTARLKTLSRS
jgi:3'-phosphoadenosine 5'-phosphosulfate sulfotransferase (PAPS reductase)/FAD synthetase